MANLNSGTIQSGDLLLGPSSRPNDPFHRTVILLCTHDTDGSFGLIINRPTDITTDKILDIDIDQHIIHLGGPVDMNRLTFLHRHGDQIQESLPVYDDIAFLGNVSDMVDMMQDRAITSKQIRFFIGHSGWEPGQLEDELKRNYWFVTRASATTVFEHDPETLWRSLLLQMGGEYAMVANFPHDPKLN
ncbi:MAG: YqgE/AlgH family protein [Bacteroidetes bacterium]|nr:YqgE/AlgH family protein [Bacteroidota bacterium]MCY4233240.1 YqgE/AlgH family protein [Bacteroidota bacterium]